VARLLGERGDFVTTWTRVIGSFAGSGPLWAMQFELVAHLARNPELRAVFAGANAEGRAGLTDLVDGTAQGTDKNAVGALYQVLLVGLAAVWLADPDSVPSGADLLAAMRAITDRA
jgi:hypothetical protein